MADEQKGLPAPTLDQVIVATIKIVDAIQEYRRKNDTRVDTTPKKESEVSVSGGIITGGQLLGTDRDVLREIDVVSNPVIISLKRTLKELGQMIYDRVGDTAKMLDIAQQIADRDPANYARRISPIDSAWDGVGKGDDRWRG